MPFFGRIPTRAILTNSLTVPFELMIKPGYRPQASDTSIETDVFEFRLLRQQSNGDRLQMSAILTQSTRQLCLSGLQQTHSYLSDEEFIQAIAQAFLGDHYSPNFIPRGNAMTWIQDSISLALQLQDILTNLYIPHYITGGVAASAYGEPRTTRDLDLVLALPSAKINTLVQQLETEGFYVPGVDDVSSGRLKILSITHQETIARADLILAGNSDFERNKFKRRRAISIPDRGTLYLTSPKDLILNKLRWSIQGESKKQWRDVLGILKVQRQTLDFNYLNQQGKTLGLSESLAQATKEAGF